MKAQLKYPIFSFAPKGNMIYVFRKEELYTTTNTKLLKKRKNYIVVDATGTKYVEKGAHKVKWQGCCELACNTLVRVSNGSFHGIQSAMPRTAGVSGNVPVGKGYKKCG